MRIGALLVALLAASAGPLAFAKGTNSHHPHQVGAAKTATHGSGPVPQSGAAEDSANRERVGDRLDIDGAGVPISSRDSGRNVKSPKLKIVKPDSVSTPRVGASNPWQPPVRNAIGQAAVSSVNAKTGGWQPDDRNVLQTEIRSGQSGHDAGSIVRVKPIAPPSASAAVASRGKIDGAALIRPTVTAAVGGPAKFAGGINGTLMRAKHR